MEWMASEIFSLFVNLGISTFSGIRGIYKKRRFKKDLHTRLFYGILDKYGNEVYYNNLDNFLSKNKVISKIIENCCNTSVSQYKSRSTVVSFYVMQFVEEYPQHSALQLEITNLIHQCFDILFNALNQIDNESTRIICNVVKEISGELSAQLTGIRDELKTVHSKIDALSDQNKSIPVDFDFKRYLEYTMRLYPSYPSGNYINRHVFPKRNSEETVDSLSALLQEKKLLILGDAGFGKTYEAITLLRSICTTETTDSILPVYLPLLEIGPVYASILDGIAYKIRPFCNGDPYEQINKLLTEGKLALILDGIDDIPESSNQTKFHAELRNFAQQYNACYYFVTCRSNRYCGGLDEFTEFWLTELDELTILSRLRAEGISTNIPHTYYQLFRNPLFLNAGIAVLKDDPQQHHFNRSTLFERLIELLYGKWNQQKGIFTIQPLCYSEVIMLIGEFSFHTFNQSAYSLVDFERRIAEQTHASNKTGIIGSLISSGIFRITDKVTFTHKLFKEYCVAYYLSATCPLEYNRNLYQSLIQKDEWKEVFIFLAGIADNLEKQDIFLDFVMENNLHLYVDCVNAKSDLVEHSYFPDNAALASRYLKLIHKTYTYIVYHYFAPLAVHFDPAPGRIPLSDRKVCILGNLSADGSHLSYWFDLLPNGACDITLIPESDIAYAHKRLEATAIQEFRNIKSHGINLKLAGQQGDTGRAIALEKIKSELDSILKKRQLLESEYLLCERVSAYKKEIKRIKDCTNLVDMQSYVDHEIEMALKRTPDLAGFHYGKIDMFSFQRILAFLNARGTKYCDSVLPAEDQGYTSSKPFWVWDFYTDEQKIRRISKFFFFHQLSYANMIESNFPALKNSFSRYRDIPYQTVVKVDLKEDRTPHDLASNPSIQFYYIASPTDTIAEPQIILEPEETKPNYTQIRHLIETSYQQKGRVACGGSFTSALFTMTTTVHDSQSDGPLSEEVYRSIRESLEEIFGDLR